jgi:hypothetical protein
MAINDGNDTNWKISEECKTLGDAAVVREDTKLEACSSQEVWLLQAEGNQDTEEEVPGGWAQYDSATGYYGTGDDD